MDEGLRFLSLTRSSFFDVPWTGAGQPYQEHYRARYPAWSVRTSGMWTYVGPPDREPPPAGWKVHVSSLPSSVDQAVDAVATVAGNLRLPWKVVRDPRLAALGHHKMAPPDMVGKICVLYPAGDAELVEVVQSLEDALTGLAGPRVLGDHWHQQVPIGVRWGASREHWIEGADGQMLPGLPGSAEGEADVRGRLSSRPLPDPLLASFDRLQDPLPVTEVRLVRRHSAGALYQARLRDGRRVALKEARHHAGIDHDGVGATQRLRHEWAALRALDGTAAVPAPVAYWTLEDSEVLVMEWLEGETLAGRIERVGDGAGELPGGPSTTHQTWTEAAAQQVGDLVEVLHQHGVAHGDLQPNNLVVSPDGVRALDLECASIDGVAVTSTTASPGFFVADPDPLVRDRFARDRIQLCLREPRRFWQVRQRELSGEDPGDIGTGSGVGNRDLTGTDWLETLASDVRHRATPQRTDRLFPGGSGQFRHPLGGHNLLHGAAGVLLVLASHGIALSPTWLDWLNRLPGPPEQARRGLALGIDGVALTLALLGREDQAAVMIDRVGVALPRSESWDEGASGCALALVELGSRLGRPDLLERGVAGLASVRAALDAGSTKAPGLRRGWAGVALALLRAAVFLPELDEVYRDDARAALELEVESLDRHHARPGMPRPDLSLGTGASALVTVVSRHPEPGERLLKVTRSWSAMITADQPAAVGLMHGLAGHVLAAGSTHTVDATGADPGSWARSFFVRTSTGWSVLGEARLRCSDDLATGTAGVIAACGMRGIPQLDDFGPRALPQG